MHNGATFIRSETVFFDSIKYPIPLFHQAEGTWYDIVAVTTQGYLGESLFGFNLVIVKVARIGLPVLQSIFDSRNH